MQYVWVTRYRTEYRRLEASEQIVWSKQWLIVIATKMHIFINLMAEHGLLCFIAIDTDSIILIRLITTHGTLPIQRTLKPIKTGIMSHTCVFAYTHLSWWRHQMETFSALLAISAGNWPVIGEFPAQRPVTRNLNKRLSKQWWGWWLETPSRPLWRHCNVWGIYSIKWNQSWLVMFVTTLHDLIVI